MLGNFGRSTRLPEHLDRHAVFLGRLEDEFGIAGPPLDFLAEVGTEFLCELIEKGEMALVSMLRSASKITPTEIDDAIVDILEDALKKS